MNQLEPHGHTVEVERVNEVPNIASEFSRHILQAFEGLNAAATDFLAMNNGFERGGQLLDQALTAHKTLHHESQSAAQDVRASLAEARKLAEQARADMQAAQAARAEIQGLSEDLKALTRELHTRIAALATLAKGWPSEQEVTGNAAHYLANGSSNG